MSLDRAAERAVIGALLLEPARFDDVREWLQPDDFDGVAERQAYEAISALASSGTDITPAAVEDRLRHRDEPTPLMADGAYLVESMQACPVASRAAVYGRMVLEMSIRRRITVQGTSLRQRAHGAVTSEDLNQVFGRVDAVRRDVERLHEREARAARVQSPTPLRVADLKPLSRPVRGEELTAERSAVRVLADRPQSLPTVARWLKPSDFVDDECAGLYSELTTLHAAGNPIDALTLAWRAKRVGLRGAVCDSLLKPPSPSIAAVDPVIASRRVLEQSVRAAVLATANALEGFAAPSGENATAMAYARLNNLWPQQRRLVKARLSSA